MSEFTIRERISWAASRETTREEDMAYCLLGIFGVYMPLIYGEGAEEAISRLQDEIIRRLKRHRLGDHSSKPDVGHHRLNKRVFE